jgi:hypothetical protein
MPHLECQPLTFLDCFLIALFPGLDIFRPSETNREPAQFHYGGSKQTVRAGCRRAAEIRSWG